MDSKGKPESGTCLLRFKLFNLQAGSPPVWQDSVYVSVRGGAYRVALGATKPLPAHIFQMGYRVAVEAPAGTGWVPDSLRAASGPRRGAGPRRDPARPPKTAPSTTGAPEVAPPAGAVPPAGALPEPPAAVTAEPDPLPVREKTRKLRRVRRLRQELDSVPPPVAPQERARTSAPLVAPPQPSAPLTAQPPQPASPPPPPGAQQAELERARLEAERSQKEVELLRQRLEAVERGLKDRPQKDGRIANVYEVKAGDTLRSISIRLYGGPEHWADLYQANSDRIQRGGDLTPGQRLVVPEVAR